MRIIPGILLLLTFVALGSGGLGFVHNLHHLEHDHAPANGHEGDPAPTEPAHHDDFFGCDLHAQLGLPLLAGGWVPLLICLGLFVAFLTLLSPPPLSRPAPLRLDCRGPPAC